jgi:guanine deaminase
MSFTVYATILQTPDRSSVETLPRHAITVGDDGVITKISPPEPDQPGEAAGPGLPGGAGDEPAVVLPDHLVLLPGLIDTHIHAPQWPQLGFGLDLPLDRWLMDYTFPLEARCRDDAYAAALWESMVPTLLGLGTTTAVYYGSVHETATVELARACIRHGQRAFVGRVAMDHPDQTPPWYRDRDAETSVAASHRSIEAIQALPGPDGLVRPIVTPRFIPACSDRALTGLGQLAEATGALVQTHCSEGDWEHGHVLDRHGCSDAASLDRFGLVRDHTVLAHATHLDDDDRRLLVDRGAGVAHCPLSNSYFANAVFPARRNLEAGVRVGLGTDIAGGPEASLLAQCGHAVTSSRMLEDGVDVTRASGPGRGSPNARIDIATAFWMATVGGAELLGIPAGLLAPGRVFDAIAVNLDRLPVRGDARTLAGGPPDPTHSGALELERIVRTADAAAIERIWVNGREVTPA